MMDPMMDPITTILSCLKMYQVRNIRFGITPKGFGEISPIQFLSNNSSLTASSPNFMTFPVSSGTYLRPTCLMDTSIHDRRPTCLIGDQHARWILAYMIEDQHAWSETHRWPTYLIKHVQRVSDQASRSPMSWDISVSNGSRMKHIGLRTAPCWSIMGLRSDTSFSNESPIGLR